MSIIWTFEDSTALRNRTVTGFAVAVLVFLLGSTIAQGQSTASVLRCSPILQEAPVGVAVRIDASGGGGSYTWAVDPGAIQEDGTSTWRSYLWTVVGTKTVTIESAGQTIDCLVIVRSAATDTGETLLTVTKQARNVSAGQTIFRDTLEARNDQEVTFALLITNTSDEDIGPLIVQDTLPSGFVPLAGSTFLGDTPISSDDITAGGVPISSLARNSSVTVSWSAVGSHIDTLPAGTRQEIVTAVVVDQGGTSAAATDLVTLSLISDGIVSAPTGSFATAATVATGPGAATILALTLAIVSSLLYAAYTRSSSFRHREVHRISTHDQIDFRS